MHHAKVVKGIPILIHKIFLPKEVLILDLIHYQVKFISYKIRTPLYIILDANRQVYARVIMRRVPNAYDPEALPLEVSNSF